MILLTFFGYAVKIPTLDVMLGEPVRRACWWRPHGAASAVAGWGLKPSGRRARALAGKLGVPFLCLEDGFLRSIDLGNREPPLSIVVDRIGIHYDATRPSELEALIADADLTEAQRERAARLPALWRTAGVSKYNYQGDYAGELPQRYVLAVDQAFGDLSISLGLAGPESFQRMLDAALAENPDCTVVLKLHPDVFAGKRPGHFDPASLRDVPRLRILTEDVHPASLLEKAEAVYVVTSQMGFEGLLRGKRVRTFGMSFYSGWGLTEDALPPPPRRRPVALENLVHAVLIAYPRYVDPETRQVCGPERLIEWMGMQRHMRARFPGALHAVAISRWKQPILRTFFAGADVRFVDKCNAVPAAGTAVVWGMHDVKSASDTLPANAQLVRIEDGFLRSVGLGSDLNAPVSWVADTRGLYYDARQPSDLECLLQTENFDDALLARAAALRQRIVAGGLTKYNIGRGEWRRPMDKRVILVPGQVEEDASLEFGAPGIRRNIELLRAVRVAHPDAYIVYKPHPDVVAGLRRPGQSENLARSYCDEIVIDLPMACLLDIVDEVHVLTSLAGFEALLRGKPVTTYGQPFYAGWGLTTDLCPLERRSRRRTLDELTAAALILYPIYVSRNSGRYTTPEQALDELLAWRDGPVSYNPLRSLTQVVRRLARKISFALS